MGKRASYLPGEAWTVGGMLDGQMYVTWHCEACQRYGPVNLLRVADAKGIDYCLVDRRTTCRAPGCGGTVYFRYAPGPGTPSRRLEAIREREDAALGAEAERAMAAAKRAYNEIARRHGRLPLP